MASEVIGQAEPVEEILTFDIPDNALEWAARPLTAPTKPITKWPANISLESTTPCKSVSS